MGPVGLMFFLEEYVVNYDFAVTPFLHLIAVHGTPYLYGIYALLLWFLRLKKAFFVLLAYHFVSSAIVILHLLYIHQGSNFFELFVWGDIQRGMFFVVVTLTLWGLCIGILYSIHKAALKTLSRG